MKNYIQFKDDLVGTYISKAQAEINQLANTLDNDEPVLYTFLPTTDSVVVTVSDAKRDELGLSSNILEMGKLSDYPMGFDHQNLVETKELMIGINSPIGSFEDAINYASAIIAATAKNNIIIVKVKDTKFTNKTWYVISTDFSNSQYLNIEAVLLGNARLGLDVAETIGADVTIDTDGITI